jgi:mono/diheme cytochrome c family protein
MSEHKISPQQQRENPEPHEQTRPVPWFMLALVAILFAFGIVYISQSGIESPSELGDGREITELAQGKTSNKGKVDGGAIFASMCVACHQANGQGLPGVFPPLAGSEWVNGRDTTLVTILLHGITGPIRVKGSTYNGAMPAFKEQLDDAQIAAVLTYIRGQWGNSAANVSAEIVAATREEHKARTAPFSGDKELPPYE